MNPMLETAAMRRKRAATAKKIKSQVNVLIGIGILKSGHRVYAYIDERLKNIEPRMIELIENEIMDNGAPVNWDDIAGLEFAKKTIKEIVVWPMLRPDIFTGLRGPPRGTSIHRKSIGILKFLFHRYILKW